MKSELRQQLHQLRNDLAGVSEALRDEDGYLLEFQWDSDENEGQLEGTPAGLTQMAMLLVDLAANEVEGAHVHFDECGSFAEGSDAIIAWKYQSDVGSKNGNSAA